LKKASKRFFFEKKKQKTFLLRAWGYGGGPGKPPVWKDGLLARLRRARNDTVGRRAGGRETSTDHFNKSFLLLFFKKEALSSPAIDALSRFGAYWPCVFAIR
jgi:hypothetical protein